MKPVFLSYRRTFHSEVNTLAKSLRMRGLRVCGDRFDPLGLSGPVFPDRLRQMIRSESGAALIYVTTDIAESPVVWEQEVPDALDCASDGDYLVLPFFRDIEPAAVSSIPPRGSRLAARDGIVAIPPAGADPSIFLREKNAEAARLLLGQLLKRESGTIKLSLQTRDVPHVGHAESDLLLDWSPAYCNDVPSAEGCAEVLQALRDLRLLLGKTSVRHLLVQPKAHLSAAITLGAIFSRPTGFELSVQQQNQLWSSSEPEEEFELKIMREPFGSDVKHICVLVAIARPEVVKAAEKAYAKVGITCGGRIVIKPKEGSSRESVPSGTAARFIAKRVADTLTQAREDWGEEAIIHLFIAAPVALAVLIGHELNALSPIFVYEHKKETDEHGEKGRYNRAFTL